MTKALLRIYELIKKYLFPFFFFGLVVIFYYPTLSGRLPAPSDAMIGLYHPYRDLYAAEYPRGVPFKNYLITDPMRQTYVWKELAIDLYKKMQLPLWNPYEMTGKPLLGNFQSGAFYPFNILFFIAPFSISWTLFIMLQSVLGGVFMYLYLRNLRLSQAPSLVGAISLTFSSFSVVWLEWGNIIHTFLWLPLILLAIDRLHQKKGRELLLWSGVYAVSVLSAFFAGYLQTFFYMFVVSTIYFLLRRGNQKILMRFLILNCIIAAVSIIQWYPTLQYILLSARSIDQNYLTIDGWFIPLQHLIQFIAPDFFGNPTTLNYWGEWNYSELGGYIGVTSLLFASLAIFVRRKITAFFIAVVVVGLVFAVDNSIARIPFQLNIPFISSSQPTRLLSVVLFSLTVLSAFGMEYLLQGKRRIAALTPLFVWIGIILLLWVLVVTKSNIIFPSEEMVATAKRNLVLPTVYILASTFLLFLLVFIKKTVARGGIILLVLLLLSFDLLRYAWKFMPFTPSQYLFPETHIISYLKKDTSIYRVGTTDQRIMAPNLFTHYKIQTAEGYDPLYLKSYGEFVASLERGKPDIRSPFGFNRIITPHNINSPLMDFLNVKYVLSLTEIESEEFIKVMEEGETKLYQNVEVSPRVFFAKNILLGSSDNEVITKVHSANLTDTAVLYDSDAPITTQFATGTASIKSYKENKITIETENNDEGFLVLSDAFYPTWNVTIDGKEADMYRTNYAFRGVVVPAGKHTVEFSIALF